MHEATEAEIKIARINGEAKFRYADDINLKAES